MGVCRQSKENELSDSAVVPQGHLEKSSLETNKKKEQGMLSAKQQSMECQALILQKQQNQAEAVRTNFFWYSGKQPKVHSNQVNTEPRKGQLKNRRKALWHFYLPLPNPILGPVASLKMV